MSELNLLGRSPAEQQSLVNLHSSVFNVCDVTQAQYFCARAEVVCSAAVGVCNKVLLCSHTCARAPKSLKCLQHAMIKTARLCMR